MNERKIAVVTGGSGGIGRATVREFAKRGYDVAVLARGEEGVQGAAKEVEQAGGRGLPITVDVADYDAVDEAVERIETELGPIDVWVNDAMSSYLALFRDVSAEEFRRVTEVTYLGQVYGTMAVLKRMRQRDRGVIVNVCSAMAYRGIPLQTAYCGAKHGVKGFTESLITELIHEKSKVKLCMVQLPGINTTQFQWVLSRVSHHPMPVPPIYQPEVAARAIVAQAEKPRRNQWVGLPTYYTILGNYVAPKLLDFYLAKTGVKSQQNSQLDPKPSMVNLWEPADAGSDHGSHGPFDPKAHKRSIALEVSLNRGKIALGLAGAAAVGAAGALVAKVR